ncbi:unnamed protein product [Pseudo-nitzschia multistriata]|uniref:Methyltransferase domain-containing protein n=1 Tax=Pseudo-nitzschia multistriata TaxID=183589 RepID=A0A448ZNJ6_9STRA|nr:unnamed protein product [Pseudo-nitzschia multistriata]
MIAPRKTLWSTPLSAVDHCMEWVPLKPEDSVLDIGCGDGRIIHRWAMLLSESLLAAEDHETGATISFVGIDIDPNRIEDAKLKTESLKADGKISPRIRITFICKNAMESTGYIQDATVIFLYLIPRGLKQIYPLIMEGRSKPTEKRNLRIISYMSKLPVLKPEGRALCKVEHQKEAAWPLYFYTIKND